MMYQDDRGRTAAAATTARQVGRSPLTRKTTGDEDQKQGFQFLREMLRKAFLVV